MNRSVVDRRDDARRKLQMLYAPIAQEMKQVDELLQAELKSDDAFVDELVKYGFRISGKRLRPALVLLAAKATGQVKPDHLVLAAVLEMIHTATLVHDDVLDEADVRRHLETVNARWNTEASVLLGDYLFTHAFYLASTLESTYACRAIGRATNVVCEGELRQVHHSGDYYLSEAEYLRIIDAKTAELTACCCQLGAHFAGADSQVEEQLDRFGRNLGIAFQIADDLLDMQGDEAATGKSLGTDLKKRKATLPIIRVLQSASPDEQAAVLGILTSEQNHRRQALEPWLARFEAVEYTRAKARYYAEAALAELEGIPDSSALEVLRALSQFVIARET